MSGFIVSQQLIDKREVSKAIFIPRGSPWFYWKFIYNAFVKLCHSMLYTLLLVLKKLRLQWHFPSACVAQSFLSMTTQISSFVNGKWLPDFIERLKASAWHQLYLPLLPFTDARSESINADSLNLQLLTARKKEWWPATADSLPQAVYLTTVKHTAFAGIEPATFRSWVLRATSCATETTNYYYLQITNPAKRLRAIFFISPNAYHIK